MVAPGVPLIALGPIAPKRSYLLLRVVWEGNGRLAWNLNFRRRLRDLGSKGSL
jgi:hypothetical protein